MPGGMTGGRRGGSRIPHRPAKIAIGGVIWTSPLPETREECDFINGAVERINGQNDRTLATQPAKTDSDSK